MAGMNPECAGDILVSGDAAETALAGRVTGAAQQPRCHDHLAHGLRQPPRQQGRLIVAPGEQAAAMQRHRDNNCLFLDEIATGPFKPGPKCRRALGAVAVLEAEDQRTAGVIVKHDRAMAAIGRRLLDAAPAQRPRSFVEFERHAAVGTDRPIDELNFRPARRAQGPVAAQTRAASQTTRRQQDINQGAQTAFDRQRRQTGQRRTLKDVAHSPILGP